MAIPRIPAYPLPTVDELPANRVSWKVDPDRAVLLIHDMQGHFVGFYDRTAEPMATVVANIARLRTECAARGVPVVFSAQPANQTPQQRGLLTDFWGDGVRDEAGARIIAELPPADGDVILTKWRYNAFHNTDLADRMAGWGRDQLVICGIYGHIGIAATATDAFMRDLQAFVVADAVADFSRTDQDTMLRYAAQRYAMVTTTDAVF